MNTDSRRTDHLFVLAGGPAQQLKVELALEEGLAKEGDQETGVTLLVKLDMVDNFSSSRG